MSPELDRLIKLQAIETRAAEAQKRIADAPAQIAALDAKLTAARDALAAAKEAVAANQATRRTLDRDLIAAQQRVSKYKEQLMAVKTNTEYHAMQHQISAAEGEVSRIEELIIVNMVEADDVTAQQKASEAAQKKDEADVAKERATIESEVAEQRSAQEHSNRDRSELLPHLDRATRDLFDRVMKAPARRGGGKGHRWPLLDLPRAPSPAGLQHDRAQRIDHPVRFVPAHPLLFRRS